MKTLVDPKGERKRFSINFTGKLEEYGKSINYNLDEVNTLSANVTVEELDEAIQRIQDPLEFAILLTKFNWVDVWRMNMVC